MPVFFLCSLFILNEKETTKKTTLQNKNPKSDGHVDLSAFLVLGIFENSSLFLAVFGVVKGGTIFFLIFDVLQATYNSGVSGTRKHITYK